MTTKTTIRAMMGSGQAMALDMTYGQALANMPMPDALTDSAAADFAISGTDIRVERGTRKGQGSLC